MIFVCAHSDLFHERVPDGWIDAVFAVMALAPQHTFQVLTKRPERARAYLTFLTGHQEGVDRFSMAMMAVADQYGVPSTRETCERYGIPFTKPTCFGDWFPLPNVWLGTSAEDQATADARIPELLAAPAAVRFLSAEPLLGPVDLTQLLADEGNDVPGPADPPHGLDALRGFRWMLQHGARLPLHKPRARLDWVIVGGESGRKARPMHPDWARSLRDQCAAAPTPERSGSARSEGEEGVPFLFKQWGSWAPGEIVPGIRAAPGMLVDWRVERAPGVKIWAGRESPLDAIPMRRLGKKAAGRLLDGVEHNGFPAVFDAARPARSATEC